MAINNRVRSRIPAGAACMIALLLLILALTGGCLRAEPEELLPQTVPPQTASPQPVITIVPAPSLNAAENTGSGHRVIAITSPKLTRIITEQGFPPEVKKAVSDFSDGRTTDTINGFLRWESVRARTNQSDSARIRDQIHLIDYALFNSTGKEIISLYIGISGEQLIRVRNDSVYEEKGYSIASYDPSVIYHRLADSGRDSEGYLTMCVIESRKGDRLLFVNTTEREFLLPREVIRDVIQEEDFEVLEFSEDSIPRHGDLILKKIRLIHTREHA